MKKFSVAILSVLTIALGSFLAACNFKKVEVSFTQSEIVFSLQETKDMNAFVEAKQLDKSQISYRFSNPDMFDADGSKLTAKNISGRCIVYATYQNNSLASTQLVVKKPFETPSNFQMNESALLTWDAVSGIFEDGQPQVQAEKYLLSGQHITYLQSGEEVSTNINLAVSTNSFQLTENGIYKLTLKAQGVGYFDDSAATAEQRFYVGYMPELALSDFAWKDGVLTWSAVSNAKYKVKVGDEFFEPDPNTNNSLDLNEYFTSAAAGEYEVSVFVYDNEGINLPKESEKLVITKLGTPTARISNGQIYLPQQDLEYEITLTAQDSQKIFFSAQGGDVTSLQGLEAGLYYAQVVAKSGEGFFFQSDAQNLNSVYKLAPPTLSGRGGNALDGSNFNLRAQTSPIAVGTDLHIYGLTTPFNGRGFNAGETTRDVVVQLSAAGTYNLSASQSTTTDRYVDLGREIYLLNSDISQTLDVTKLAPFSTEISHAYDKQNNVSVLSFAKVEGATQYELLPTGDTFFKDGASGNFVVDIQDETVTITLAGTLENVFSSANEQLTFQVVAKTQDDTLAINSSVSKTMTKLSAPVMTSQMDSTNSIFSWSEVENAEGYRLEIYTLTKQEYQDAKNDANFVPETKAEISPEDLLTETKFDLEKEGYYCVRVYAHNSDENTFLTGENFLQEVFYVQKQLVLGQVQFGYGEDLPNAEGLTGASGYFLLIDFSDNVTKYQLVLDANTANEKTENFEKTENGTNMLHQLSENFESGVHTISLVGLGEDETVYVSTAPYTFAVERLASITEYDFEPTDSSSRLKIDDFMPNQTISVHASTADGVRNIILTESEQNYVSASESASLNISKLDNFNLTFNLEGTKSTQDIFNDTKVEIFDVQDGKIYLDAAETNFNFVRIDAPSGLQFYDGKLKFNHSDALRTQLYVLDMVCITNNNQQNAFSVRFGDAVTAHFESSSSRLGSKAEFVEVDGNNVSIDFYNVIEKLKTNNELSSIYNQSSEISFSLYAHQSRFSAGQFELSSSYATTQSSGETSLKIEKMKTTQLSFDANENALIWDAAAFDENTPASVKAETTYEIFVRGEENPRLAIKNANCAFDEETLNGEIFGKTLFVRVKNPYFIGATDSNFVTINKIAALSKVSLTNDGKLTFTLPSAERAFCQKAELSIGGGEAVEVDINAGIGNVLLQVDGQYAFKLLGSTQTQEDGSTVYYLDSDIATFNVKNLSTIAPDDMTLNIENNQLSWNAVDMPLAALQYVLIFKDENASHAPVVYKTQNTSVNWNSDDKLRESLDNLDAGTITVSLSAFLQAHEVAAGGTVYYAEAQMLLNGNQEFNHLIYTNAKTIKKLAKPEIVGVQFETLEGSENIFIQDGAIQIKIAGNYGNSAAFQVYREGEAEAIYALTNVQKEDDGTYLITLEVSDYGNYVSSDQSVKFKIYALNVGEENLDAIPSSAGEVVFNCAHTLTDVRLVGENDNQALRIVYSHANEVVGGIVLTFNFGDTTKTELLPVAADSTNLYVDYANLSQLISENLPNGGTLKVSAYVNCHTADGVYTLASQTFESETFEVLKPTRNVANKDFGFVIEDENQQDVKYIVDFNGKIFEVEKNEAAEFAFIVPNEWENEFGPYILNIYAAQNGKISSVGFEYSFSLNRIESVGTVSVRRDETLSTSISWDAVAGADGYIVKIYKRNGTEKGSLIHNIETTNHSFTLAELFGEGYTNIYENAIGTDKFTYGDLMGNAPCEIFIEIITKGGSGKNNSKAKLVNASIMNNPISAENVSVDSFGNVVFADKTDALGNLDFTNGLEKNYYYRFVSGDGSPLYSDDGQLLSVWTKMTQNILDTSKLDVAGLAFNLEVVVMGDEQTDSNSAIVFDSKEYSTVTLSQAFFKLSKLLEVGVDTSDNGYITFTTEETNFDCIYAGLNVDAILTGDVFAIYPNQQGFGSENNQYVFAYPLDQFVSLLSEKNLTAGEVGIFFWLHQASADNTSLTAHSDAFEFSFNLMQDVGLKEIVKDEISNTFVVFDNDSADSITAGIFVKIETTDSEVTKFIAQEALEENLNKFDGLSINLTSIFETDETLNNVSGKVKISFARAALKNFSTYAISNWSEPIEFDRLESASNLQLENGNLNWMAGDEKTTKYVVYFYSNIDEQIYTHLSTQTLSLNVSEHTGKDDVYFLAVQAVDEKNLHTLSSQKVFKLDNFGQLQQIYKNQINSPLKLSGGKLVIDWTTDGFFDTLTQNSGSYAVRARELANSIFTSPFTFTLQELVDGNVIFRMRFTPITEDGNGIGKTFDVRAIDLLASLIDFGMENEIDVLSIIDALYRNAESVIDQTLINRFRNAIISGSYGVANPSTIFDQYFEQLQMGRYSLEYCLISSTAMNSAWYTFENAAGQNEIFVNEQPQVNVLIDSSETQKAYNQFKVIIKKSKIWQYDSTEKTYVQVAAENYVMKLGGQAYSIYKDVSSDGSYKYKLMQLGVEESKVIDVYECDQNGNAGTEYLMFYLNYNNGNSLLGSFTIEARGSQEMQIYAVGNDVSISSKSEYFSVTFLKFDTFSVSEGVFVWGATYQNRATTVLVQKSTDRTDTKVTVDGSRTTSQFALDGNPDGVYTLKFIIEGEVRGNVILVDSDTYFVERVVKLSNPNVYTSKGNLAINVNLSQLGGVYSDNGLQRFVIHNDSSGPDLTRTFTNTDGSATTLYEVGTTNLSESDPDYAYKRTEEFANNFQIRMLGSTATLKCEKESEQNYHLQKILCVDLEGGASSRSIAVRSELTSFDASMLDTVQNIRVEDGILRWDEVSGRSGSSVDENSSIVYKLTIDKYRKSNTSTGTADTNIEESQVYYTANTHFDMSLLQKDATEGADVFMRATVQALSLFISQEMPYVDNVQLIEGGFGYGSPTFAEQEKFVLMGNCRRSLDDIQRLASVQNLDVKNGCLTWSYADPSADVDAFRDLYDFIVMDKTTDQQILGNFEINRVGTNLFEIIFHEFAGQMKAQEMEINVTVTQGRRNPNIVLRSFAESLLVTKLKTITSQDFAITSDTENNTETLNLEEFFKNNPNETVLATIEIDGVAQEFRLNAQNFKLYILTAEQQNLEMEGYVGWIVVGDNFATMKFKVIRENLLANQKVIFGDESETFSLKRTDWQGYEISWHNDSQEFTWDYDLSSFNDEVTAECVRYGYFLTAQTAVYETDGGQQVDTLPSGTEIVLLDTTGTGDIKISYNGTQGFIARTSRYERRLVTILDEADQVVTQELSADKMFKLVENQGETSIIEIDGQLFRVATSSIVAPVFIVQAKYTFMENGQEITQNRTYSTTAKVFRPNVIGKAQISVRIKINNSNLLSEGLQSTEVNFNLFEDGHGTAEKPYVIANQTQFKNIAYRMSKDDEMKRFVLNSATIDEDEEFHFVLQTDLRLDAFNGILFSGEFSGVIDGNSHTISYTTTGVGRLQNSVRIAEDDTAVYYTTNDRALTYTRGSALFETLTENANIKNLNLSVVYGTQTFVQVEYHSLMASLAIINEGRVENVNLTNFENHFYGDYDPCAVMAYSGIVSINRGGATISGCSATADMSLNDNGRAQVISVSGIAYTNYGTIENCTSGVGGKTISVVCQELRRDRIQVAGIAITNTQSATIRDCTNHFNLDVSSAAANNATCYMAGVVVLGKGSVAGTNHGQMSAINIQATTGDISAKRS